MSTEIIQLMPQPNRDDAQTDFPTIAFRSAMPDPVTAHADADAVRYAEPKKRES